MGKFCQIAIFLVYLCLAPGKLVWAAEIQTINIDLHYANLNLDPAVKQRMQDSLKPIAEQLLLGRDAEQLKPNNIIYQELFKDIINRVFTGYQVSAISLELEKDSKLQVNLQPWSETINSLKINYDYSGIQELWQPLVALQATKVSAGVENIFQGMPIEATFWLNSVARERVYQQAQLYLPEFKVVSQMHGEKNPEVDFTLIPLGQEVQSVGLRMHSKNIPKLLLLESKNTFQKTVNTLRGLPVEFVRKNQQAIELVLLRELNKDKFIARYKLLNKLNIIVAETVQVDVQLDLADYNFWVEGYLDLGRSEKSSSGTMHIGYDLSSANELFVESSLYTDSMEVDVDLAWAHRYKKTTATYLRRLNSQDNVFRLQHQFNPDWGLRVERKTKEHENEFAVSYRVHEFFTAEYVFSNKERYFRIITRL